MPPPQARALGNIAVAPAFRRSAALRVTETREKPLLDRGSARELAAPSPARRAAIGPLRRLPLAARYQERSSAANAVYVGRTPVPPRNGAAQLNRFVFRREAGGVPSVSQPVVATGADKASAKH